MIVIDLNGPDGNAYALIGYAIKLSKSLGLDPDPIVEDMKFGDYENLLEVFQRHFGEYVTFVRD